MKKYFVYISRLLLVLNGAAFFFFPAYSHAKVLLEDTVWEGEILVEEDIVVPQGISLTVRKGAVVRMQPSDSTKTDPEYMSSMTEITIRGELKVEGTPESPVLFRREPTEGSDDPWAGIIIDGGTVAMQFTTIKGAETGIWVIGGRADIHSATFAENRYGMLAQTEGSKVRISGSTFSGNEYGLLSANGAVIEQQDNVIARNGRVDFFEIPPAEPGLELRRYEAEQLEVAKEIEDEEVLVGDVVWKGRIVINSRVRVPDDSRLIILPGTIVEFRKKDTNGDGIGENGLMLQGVLIAKGTADKPIIFRSAEENRSRGDWDAINIINSDGVRNIIEYCQIEDAYRGMHFHFSNAFIQHSIFRNSSRGIQFQESTVDLRRNIFYDNTSGIQARDSRITFIGNQVVNNVFGANFLRAHLTIEGNRFANNLDFGLKVREGYPTVAGNVLDHNRFGLMFSDTSFGIVTGNLLMQNGEVGLSIRTGANMEITDNFVQANGLSGISVRDTLAVIRDNHISENGERGIGVISFLGPITGNTIVDNGLYAIATDDASDVTAQYNWFGEADMGQVIFDREDDPARGRVHYAPAAELPPAFTWPLGNVVLDTRWSGMMVLTKDVLVPAGTALTVEPGTRVLFAKDVGMKVRGRFTAQGTVGKRITFSSADARQPASWGEIALEYAEGSKLSNCDFEYATWGIHCHFTALPVRGCSFTNNTGGMRFRSGPVVISNSRFSDNYIGIRAYLGKATITGNIITRNAKGIFVREKGGGLMITGNNIYANTDYNIWVGDFNTEDIPAPGNWWGIDNPVETFFDARREPGIGTVLYEPLLSDPLEIKIEDQEVK